MSVNVPNFPDTVWDGRTPNRESRADNRSPNYEDWDQISIELIATQQYLADNPPGGGGAIEPYEAESDSTLEKGAPVYMLSNGHIDAAQADSMSTSKVAGLLTANVTAAASGSFIRNGSIQRTDWTNILGTAALTPGAKYWLDPASPGMITATPTTTVGQVLVKLGEAVSTTTLNVEVEEAILL